jgi:mgtE-like transporter
LTFSISLVLGALAKVMSEAFGIRSISMADFVVISVLGGVASSVAVGAFTAFISVQAFRRGWDLDSVTAPLVTAAGDIVTIPSLYLATFAVGIDWVTPAVAAVMAVVSLGFLVRGLTSDLRTTRRVVRQSLALLCAAGTVDIMAGIAVESRLERFIEYPVLLVLIPPLLADAGAMGGILSSRLASKLHLGALDPRARPQVVALLDTTIVMLFAIWIFALLGLAADIVAGVFGMASPGAWEVVGISLTAGLLSTVFAVVIAYYVAVASYRLGADPDSHGIPVITSSMDLIGVVCLMITLALFGIV